MTAEQFSLALEETGLSDGLTPAGAEQLALDGMPPGRARARAAVPSEVWRQLLNNRGTRARYAAKIHRRGSDQCWYWTGAISSTGHGKLQATGEPGRHVVVTAHVYGYQLEHGPIRPRSGEDPVVAHCCDETGCQNPRHWELIERVANAADYLARRWRTEGPLADVRGAEGRAVAIREAIKSAYRVGTDVETAIAEACAAGLRPAPGLFDLG